MATVLPAAGYFSQAGRTNGEAKTAQDDLLNYMGNLPGGAAPQELTIASGDVIPPDRHGGHLLVDTEGDAATDDLEHILTTHLHVGAWVFVRAADNARTVVVKHAAGGDGTLQLVGADDFTLDDTRKWIFFVHNAQGTLTEVMRDYGADDAGFRTFRGITNPSVASTTVSGQVELATRTEVDTGDDATRAVTPAALAGSYAGKKAVHVTVFAPDATLSTGNNKANLFIPEVLDGMNLTRVAARHIHAGGASNGITTIQLRNTSTGDMLSTRLTIDAAEVSSSTAATRPVMNTSRDHVQTNQLIAIDIDAVNSTAKGLLVVMEFTLP